jgi:hypothetical protein
MSFAPFVPEPPPPPPPKPTPKVKPTDTPDARRSTGEPGDLRPILYKVVATVFNVLAAMFVVWAAAMGVLAMALFRNKHLVVAAVAALPVLAAVPVLAFLGKEVVHIPSLALEGLRTIMTRAAARTRPGSQSGSAWPLTAGLVAASAALVGLAAFLVMHGMAPWALVPLAPLAMWV